MGLKQKTLNWAKHQKRWFGKWHLYLGIFAGAILAFVGLTGSILVFQDEIDRALNPELFNIGAAQHKIPFDEIIPLIKRKNPGIKIDYLMDKDANDPRLAYRVFDYKTEKETFFNPYTGAISGKRLYESGFIHVVTELHRTLLIPVAGRYIVGLASLSMVILIISGLRLWIPQKWKQLKSALTVRFSGSFKRKNYDWHNVLGFYSSPVVAMIALTGFCITFSTIVIPLLFVFSGKSPQGVVQLLGAKSAYHKNAVPLPLKDILAVSIREIPGGRVAGVAFPTDHLGTYRLDILSKGTLVSGKREMLIVDQYTGKALLNSRSDFPNVGNAYLSWMTPIHFGSFGGLPTQILALIAGLIPISLFITGFLIWWPRHKKQRGNSKKTVQPITDEMLKEVKKPARSIVSEHRYKSLWTYFFVQVKGGISYASIVLLVTMLMGGLYGLIVGIIIEPAVFALAFSAILVCMNFICAIFALLFNTIFLVPFKKGKQNIIRYFAWSFSFMILYAFAYTLVLNTGIKFF